METMSSKYIPRTYWECRQCNKQCNMLTYTMGDAKILSSNSRVKIVKLSKNDSLSVFDTIDVTENWFIINKLKLSVFLLDESVIIMLLTVGAILELFWVSISEPLLSIFETVRLLKNCLLESGTIKITSLLGNHFN